MSLRMIQIENIQPITFEEITMKDGTLFKRYSSGSWYELMDNSFEPAIIMTPVLEATYQKYIEDISKKYQRTVGDFE